MSKRDIQVFIGPCEHPHTTIHSSGHVFWRAASEFREIQRPANSLRELINVGELSAIEADMQCLIRDILPTSARNAAGRPVFDSFNVRRAQIH